MHCFSHEYVNSGLRKIGPSFLAKYHSPGPAWKILSSWLSWEISFLFPYMRVFLDREWVSILYVCNCLRPTVFLLSVSESTSYHIMWLWASLEPYCIKDVPQKRSGNIHSKRGSPCWIHNSYAHVMEQNLHTQSTWNYRQRSYNCPTVHYFAEFRWSSVYKHKRYCSGFIWVSFCLMKEDLPRHRLKFLFWTPKENSTTRSCIC